MIKFKLPTGIFYYLNFILIIFRVEEGVFARWKKFEALYITMTDHKIESLTRAVTNKVGEMFDSFVVYSYFQGY